MLHFYYNKIRLSFEAYNTSLRECFYLQLQELANQLIDLWNLMDTPDDERELFDHVTCNISASVDEVTIPGALALDLIEQVTLSISQCYEALIRNNLFVISSKGKVAYNVQRTSDPTNPTWVEPIYRIGVI